MYLSTLFLPLYLMGAVVSSPIHGRHSLNLVPRSDSGLATIPESSRDLVIIPLESELRVGSDPTTKKFEADKRFVHLEARTKSPDFTPASSELKAKTITMVVHGISVLVRSWLGEGGESLFVEVTRAFPGGPNTFTASIRDSEGELATTVATWTIGAIASWRPTGAFKGHTFRLGDIFHFEW